ncbi:MULTISPECIES: DNA adenine methylase [Chryseobacterium]|uniref:Site-specific DNA-methyltransferase (adenine-specific) n=1 Tax=Chryseobacterium culicis TaxID=680127 RepID=A0A1H6H777_CHRCI|nr:MULTISPECIES: Dam family site-specific DNA-(adenine-N6)-methyltransferase [Chryseobacterium]UHO38209.1 Dam family site-specific DNA-(adenine-N6)-methyltransferase [Chryseobacterium capnotolerans]SEH29910.1 DNA adenine methylase [Chryseobacterium culicis]
MTKEKKIQISNFLRWTGSKRWFVKDHIQKFLPHKFNNYHEPFLGGGSVFFFIKQFLVTDQKEFYLSDTNKELINVYEQLRDGPEDVINCLKKFKNSKDDYYKIRNYNPRINSKKAAKFIYLNRTSFNGIYRVNANGIYNVPYGHRPNVDFVTEDLLRNVSKLLQGIKFSTQSFEEALLSVKKGDLVFLDPPYTVAHENNGFIEYNQKLFSWDDQERLKQIIEQIISREAFFILTNASHHSIEDLYNGIANITVLSRPSIVGGRSKTRGIYNELIIYNF